MEKAFVNKSEACTASSRLLVQRTIYDHFVEKLATGVRKPMVGSGMDSKMYVGPCVSKKQQERVLDYIHAGAEISAQRNLSSGSA
jgi:acyl-CoA reductase-like NAD-dependent aldehyde dehydrogenase